MSTVLSSLSEIATSLFQSLRLSYLLPAFIFWVLNAVFIFPSLPEDFRNFLARLLTPFKLEPVTLIFALSLLSGYFLYVLNTNIIRWFEGYPWKECCLIRWLAEKKIEWHRHYRDRLQATHDTLAQRRVQLWKEFNQIAVELNVEDPKLGRLYQQAKHQSTELGATQVWYAKKLQYLYPTSRLPFLPTKLGNVIASFEDYPHGQYGMDAVTLWPRFVPILTQVKYSLYLEREKANLDFLLNLCLALLFFCIELFLTGFLFAQDMKGWLIAIGFLLVIIYLFYLTSITGASGWGTTVRVAFDLYRYELLAALNGYVPKDHEQEKQIWLSFSSTYRDLGVNKLEPKIDFNKIRDIFTNLPQTTKGANN